ncbi:MAG: hypothetical protein ACKOOH_04260 [Cyanobium sp.]
MHRLPTTSGPAEADGAGGEFTTHPPAEVVLLSSAETDLLALARLIENRRPPLRFQGVPLAKLQHPAGIDHYISTTLEQTGVLVVRLLGGRGHWSYGIDQLRLWQQQAPKRHLLLLAGTAEEDGVLGSLASVPEALNLSLAQCFRIGGQDNLLLALDALIQLPQGTTPPPPTPLEAPDPLAHDWRMDPGPRVGVVLYRALRQAGDTALMESLLGSMRERGLCPRALWVSGLRDPALRWRWGEGGSRPEGGCPEHRGPA